MNCNNRFQDFRCNSPMTCEGAGRCPYLPQDGDPGDPRWERVGGRKMEECAPGIAVTFPAREMDADTRTSLLYALGGPPWRAA